VKVLDFIGNHRHAGRMLHYMEEIGAGLPVDRLHERPSVRLHTGCQISFEEEAIETLRLLDRGIPEPSAIIEEFFGMVRERCRVPSFEQWQARSRYRAGEVLALFGSWGKFRSRLATLAPEWELGPMAWPERFEPLDPESLRDAIDRRAGDLDEIAEIVSALLAEIEVTFVDLGELPRDGRGAERAVRGLARDLADRIADAQSYLHELVFLCGLVDRRSGELGRRGHVEPVGAPGAVGEALARISDHRDVYTFARSFATTMRDVEELRAALRDFEAERLGGDDFLEMGTRAERVQRRMRQAHNDLTVILRAGRSSR
jgi:hypothetical protein